MNFTIMYLLAPTAAAAGSAAATPLVARLIGDHYLKAWGAPGEARGIGAGVKSNQEAGTGLHE